MRSPPPQDTTALLLDWGSGDRDALDRLMPVVAEELRRMAHRQMRRERIGHSLQTTALIHEAYLRLVDYRRVQPRDRAHFLAIAAQAMRRVLVEQARERATAKRGGGIVVAAGDEVPDVVAERAATFVALDDALATLAQLHLRQAQVVELRYFGGLTNDEVAAALGISVATVERDWQVARLWLRRELGSGDA